MSLCTCGNSYGNTGYRDCPAEEAPAIIVFAPYLDSTGARTVIDVTDANFIADPVKYFTDRINAALPADRLYPVADIKNVGGERAASEFETFDDNTKRKIREGIRNFTALVVDGSPLLLGNLQKFGCSEKLGVYIIDIQGNLRGQTTVDNLLYPMMIDMKSYDVYHQPSTAKTSSKIVVNWDFSRLHRDASEKLITAGSVPAADLLSIFEMGLLDISAEVVSHSTTQIVIDLVSQEGGLIDRIGATGLVIGDFFDGATPSKVHNVTTSASVTLTSVTVDPVVKYRYTLNFTAQTVGDKIQVGPVKEGYDFSAVLSSPVTL